MQNTRTLVLVAIVIVMMAVIVIYPYTSSAGQFTRGTLPLSSSKDTSITPASAPTPPKTLPISECSTCNSDNGDTTFTRNVDIPGDLNVDGLVNIDGSLGVNGGAATGPLTVYGGVQSLGAFSSQVYSLLVRNNLDVEGSMAVVNDVSITGTLFVDDKISTDGNLETDEKLIVGNSANFYGNIYAYSLANCSGKLYTDSQGTVLCGTDQIGTGTTDHGALTGLTDDDHPQYVKKVGDTMTSDLNFPNQNTGIGFGATGAGSNVWYKFHNLGGIFKIWQSPDNKIIYTMDKDGNTNIGGTLTVSGTKSCSATTGKLYTDANGKILCGTDQTGSGLTCASCNGGALTIPSTAGYEIEFTGANDVNIRSGANIWQYAFGTVRFGVMNGGIGVNNQINSVNTGGSYAGDLYLQYGAGTGNVQLGNTAKPVALLFSDYNTAILEGSGNSLRIQTNYGYGDIGSQNTGYFHFVTDRPTFWFNRDVLVQGAVKPFAGAYNLGDSSNKWGTLYVNTVEAGKICLNGDCKTSWSTGSSEKQYAGAVVQCSSTGTVVSSSSTSTVLSCQSTYVKAKCSDPAAKIISGACDCVSTTIINDSPAGTTTVGYTTTPSFSEWQCQCSSASTKILYIQCVK